MVFYKMRILIPWALIRRGSFAQVFFLEALFPGAAVQRRHPLAGGVAFFAVFSYNEDENTAYKLHTGK